MIATGNSVPDDILRDRVLKATDWDFIERVVRPAVYATLDCSGSSPAGPSQECKASVCYDDDRGRVVIQYDFEDDVTAFGKLFSDRLGAHSHDVLKGLWDDGFRNDQPYRVPQPLVFLPADNFLLASAAEGIPFTKFIGRDDDEALDHVRRAAGWLARMHRSSLRCGVQPSVWESSRLDKLFRRLAKTTMY